MENKITVCWTTIKSKDIVWQLEVRELLKYDLKWHLRSFKTPLIIDVSVINAGRQLIGVFLERISTYLLYVSRGSNILTHTWKYKINEF